MLIYLSLYLSYTFIQLQSTNSVESNVNVLVVVTMLVVIVAGSLIPTTSFLAGPATTTQSLRALAIATRS